MPKFTVDQIQHALATLGETQEVARHYLSQELQRRANSGRKVSGLSRKEQNRLAQARWRAKRQKIEAFVAEHLVKET